MYIQCVYIVLAKYQTAASKTVEGLDVILPIGYYILSVNEKIPGSKFRYFGKCIIQLEGYFCIYVSGQRQTGLEKKYHFHEPRNYGARDARADCVLAVFENLIASFSLDNMSVHAPGVYNENATNMYGIIPINNKNEDQPSR